MSHDSTHVLPAPRRQVYPKISVTVTHGPDTGQSVEAAGSVVRVGSAADNDLVLTDDSVSRHHCEIEPTAGGLRVRDDSSTNGVAIGSMRVRDATVVGDVDLTLGSTVVAVRWLGDQVDKEQARSDRFGNLLGQSVRMRELFAQLAKIAGTDYTVLIEGETGTGKDVVAESLHQASARAARPFVVLDCGAVSPHVIESELFGHERGAFTGAVDAHAGVFERAHTGTLFIDEIGELSMDLQPKLLRVLEKRQLRRVGGQHMIAVDVRVMSATNCNLRARMGTSQFREDLYYRLAAAHVRVPPLRDHLEDLEMLVGHFLAKENSPPGVRDIPHSVWDMFRAHRWPGNVRELRNAVQRLALNPEQPITGVSQRPEFGDNPTELLPLREARRRATDAFERTYLQQLLRRADGNVTHAAPIAEVSRQMLQKLMRKHGVISG